MERSYSTSFFFVISMLASDALRAQGCSDAGACSAGPIGELQLAPDSLPEEMSFPNDARLSYILGIGERKTVISQVQPQLDIALGGGYAVQMKVPYVFVNGDLGSNQGIGDVIATASRTFIAEKDRAFSVALGMRLPTGNTTASATDPMDAGMMPRPLPMPYQTGLGTTDLIAGINWRYHHFMAALAYQQVLHQGNANTFTPAAWENNEAASGYFASDHLERANDLVIRAQYAFGNQRLTLRPGLLAIYHLSDDTRLEDNQRVAVDGSQGLTLNVTADVVYALNDRWSVEGSFGAPLVTREARPDGLTRESVLAIGLRYRF